MPQLDHTSSPLIRFETISKSYTSGGVSTTVLDRVSFDIQPGEFISIVGSSGSGKTTLVHIIGGLLSPTSGKMFVDGQRFDKTSDKKRSQYRNQQVGFVFQNYNVLPEYTVLENVTLPLMLAGEPVATRTERARECLRLVGMLPHAHKYATQLSGGQKQRVSIARALAHKPSIIIADEPTGNLDTHNGQLIMKVLIDLNKRAGVTLVLVTHNQALATLADRIFHIADGVVTEAKR
ncbi:MAG TPA: ABC transporter ATP-binding protein [Candidatus Saccharimonadales bacterium]|jgi:putative ABC transport system ATP-binding protein|nr:ABC transporter ATP-binding protein [Candidatus Saccharimonadales bacterium]